jgi:DDE superfamily endonuclease
MLRPDLHLPQAFVAWMAPFLAAFCRRSRDTAAALAVGALLAIGPRTVTNCLRALGLAEHPGFTAFHRVLNRNVWSGLALGRTLLRLLVPAFEPGRPSSSSASIIPWNDAAVARLSRPAISTTPFAPPPNRKSPVGVCAGSAPCCWSRCRLPVAFGDCRC